MICSRRLYKGNTYEICLPLTDTGVTLVRFYTRGDVIIEKEPEITGDSMCFSFTEEEIASLEDGVLRYEIVTEYETTDTNSPYVIVTPGDYSGSTLDDLLEDAFDSGYTAGQEDCSGGSCEHVYESGYTDGYTSGYTDGSESVDCSPFYDSGVTDGYASGYTSGHTDGFEEGYASGTTDGWQPAYDSGFTDGVNSVECSGYTQDLIANLQGDYFVIPEGTERLREYALANISGLTSITIPDSVWEIGYRAFYDDRYLQSVTLGSGLHIIGQGAFHFCHRLTGITIPASVESIENNAFHYCSGLTHMTFEGLTPPNIYANALGSTAYTFPIYVPCESVEAYKSAAPDYASRITCIPGPEPEPAYSGMPLTFEIISGGTIGWDNSQTNIDIEYSVDSGRTWSTFSTLNVNAGDHVLFRGSGATAQGIDTISKFTASTDTYFEVYGNAYSLLNGNNYTGITNLSAYTTGLFFGLFSGNTGLLSAENLILQAVVLSENCYRDMFSCCPNLTTAPELPAETLATGCYWNMFAYCSSLNYIKCLAIDRSATGCTSVWVTNVPQFGGTFVKHPNATWGKGMNEIPAGWTVVNAQL